MPPVIKATLVGPLLLPSPRRPRPLGAAAARAGAASLVPGEGDGEHDGGDDGGGGDDKDCGDVSAVPALAVLVRLPALHVVLQPVVVVGGVQAGVTRAARSGKFI